MEADSFLQFHTWYHASKCKGTTGGLPVVPAFTQQRNRPGASGLRNGSTSQARKEPNPMCEPSRCGRKEFEKENRHVYL